MFSLTELASLYEAAEKVCFGGASPEELRGPLESLRLMAEFRDSEAGQAILQRASEHYAETNDYDVEIDYGTIVYHNGTDGYWVMGWCFIDEEDDDDNDDAVEEEGEEHSEDQIADQPTILRGTI